jgi:capsular polysaccharide biosynthesis protein
LFRGIQRQAGLFGLALLPTAGYLLWAARPVHPRSVILIFVLSLAVIALWILWREWTVPTFQSERQLAQYMPDVPLLGSMPDLNRLASRIDDSKRD